MRRSPCVLILMCGLVACGDSSGGGADAAVADAGRFFDARDDARIVDAGVVCSDPLPCDPPSGPGGDMVCISGRVLDGLTWVGVPQTTSAEIEIALFEPLNFLSDATTPPFKRLTVANGGIDACGRYSTRFSTSQDTPNGLLILRLADPEAATTKKYVQTAVLVAANVNTTIPVKPLFLVSAAQDAAWSNQAGMPAGSTFAKTGSIAVRYHTASSDPLELFPGTPIAGVTPTWMAMGDPDGDYFFTDVSGVSATTIGPTLSKTGGNGMALLTVGKSVNTLGAVTGTPGTCTKSGGAPGTLTQAPSTSGSAVGVILFTDLVGACN